MKSKVKKHEITKIKKQEISTMPLRWMIIIMAVFILSALAPIIFYQIYYFEMGHEQQLRSPLLLLFTVLPCLGFWLMVWRSKDTT